MSLRSIVSPTYSPGPIGILLCWECGAQWCEHGLCDFLLTTPLHRCGRTPSFSSKWGHIPPRRSLSSLVARRRAHPRRHIPTPPCTSPWFPALILGVFLWASFLVGGVVRSGVGPTGEAEPLSRTIACTHQSIMEPRPSESTPPKAEKTNWYYFSRPVYQI